MSQMNPDGVLSHVPGYAVPATLTVGWHWKEWLAELGGTAAPMFAVVTAKYWAVRAGRPVSDLGVRTAIVALVAGLTVLTVAVSPADAWRKSPIETQERPAGRQT
jgi:hypothetical protein